MKKKVLICTFSMGVGGMETFLKNIVNTIDKNKFEIKFAINQEPIDKTYINILKENNIKFEYIGNVRPNPYKYLKRMNNFMMKEGPFDVIHTNLEYQGALVLMLAKKNNIKKRIAHSHTTNVTTFYNKLFMPLYRFLFRKYATTFFACGEEAGEYMFGRNINFKVIKNGIDVNKFLNFSVAEKKKLCIGQIGRLSKEKNQLFSIKIIEELHKRGKKFHLYLIGDGPERSNIEKEINEKELNSYVHLLGMQNDIAKFYHQFNIFLLPSLYEGVPYALLEAQGSSAFTFASQNVSKESDLGLGLLEFVPLDVNQWVEKILTFEERTISNDEILKTFEEKGFNLNSVIKILEVEYEI